MTHAPTNAFLDELQRVGISYEVIPHARTMSAVEEAATLGLSPEIVAKTVVLRSADGFVRAVVPASHKLDLEKVRTVLGQKQVDLATEAMLASTYPEFELGAVPPFGGGRHDPLLVDIRICAHTSVVLEAGRHDRSARVAVCDVLAHEPATIADICHE